LRKEDLRFMGKILQDIAAEKDYSRFSDKLKTGALRPQRIDEPNG
jgi:hypothetical protein